MMRAMVLVVLQSGDSSLKVFISSIVSGMKEFRDAAAEGISVLGHEPMRAESFGASPESPREACLKVVRESDVLVLILGERYGEIQGASGVSATHEEYREARNESCDVLVMVRENVNMEAAQQQFLKEVQGWESGHHTGSFNTPSELKDEVIKSLHELELARERGEVDSDEMLERAVDSLAGESEDYYNHEPQIAVAIASGPYQSVLNPAELESDELEDAILKIALFGENPIFTTREGTEASIDEDALVIQQEGRVIYIQEDGTLDLTLDLPRQQSYGSVVIEENVQDVIELFIQFGVEVLAHIDSANRLSHAVVVAKLISRNSIEWRTRQEHSQSSGGFTSPNPFNSPAFEPVCLPRPELPRSMMKSSVTEIAADLTVLLRRQLKS